MPNFHICYLVTGESTLFKKEKLSLCEGGSGNVQTRMSSTASVCMYQKFLEASLSRAIFTNCPHSIYMKSDSNLIVYIACSPFFFYPF